MTQNCLMAAALILTALLACRLGTLLPAGRRQREYTLADLAEHPAILLGMRCGGGDRESFDLLRESLALHEAEGAPASAAADRAPDFFQ